MEYQTATFSPTLSTLQPPFQVSPTSNERETPMFERQPEFNPPQYMSQFPQPNQHSQFEPPGQWQVFDQGHQHNVTLPAEEDISFGQYVEENEHTLSPFQQVSIRGLLNSETPVSTGMNTLQPDTLSPTEQRVDLSQYPPLTQQLIPSQFVNPAWTQGQSGQLSSPLQDVQPQRQSVQHRPVQQQPVQQPALQQAVLNYPLQSPPIQQEPIHQPPLHSVPSIQSTSPPPQLQPKPAFQGELYKILIQPEIITPTWNKPEKPRPLVVEQLKEQSVPPSQNARILPPQEPVVVDTAGNDPLLSPKETLPDSFAGRSESLIPKEAESQLSPKDMYETVPLSPPQNNPSTSIPLIVTDSEPKKSDLNQTSPLTSPKQSPPALQNPNSQRETLLAVLKTIRPPLTERELSATDRIISLNFNQQSLFGALVLENIITPELSNQFWTVFTSINDTVSGSTAAPAQYHTPLPLSSTDDASVQTTTAAPSTSLNQSHSTPSTPALKSTTPKASTKQTQSTPPKQLQSQMSSPLLKQRITKLFLQRAMETHRSEFIDSITSLAKNTKTILQFEAALKDRGIFTAQEVVKVEQFAVMELRKERENEQSSQSASNQDISRRGETSLENTSGLAAQLAKDASASRVNTPKVSVSHDQPVSQNPATKGSNVSTLPTTNVQNENADAPLTTFEAPTAQKHTGNRGRPPKVRTAAQNPTTNGSNEITNASTIMNGAGINGYAPDSNGAQSNPSAPKGKEDATSDPSAPQVHQRRPRKLRSDKAIIARALPDRADLDLSNTITSWPENQIARNILIAAGRDIPGEETAPLNADFESIKNTWPELKKADLRTLEWDVIDPPKVDLLAAIRKTLEITQRLPKDFMKPGRGRGRPPTNTAWRLSLIPSSSPSTQLGVGEVTKPKDIDNHSLSGPFETQPLDFPPPTLTGNGMTGTTTGTVSTRGGDSPGGSNSMLRRQSSHSASPATPRLSVPKPVSTTSTPATPKKRGRKPKSDLPKTPVQITEVTPRKLTPQVVIITPRKTTTPEAVVITDDDVIDITPTKSSGKNATRRQSKTSSLIKRNSVSPIAKSTAKRSATIGLTKRVQHAKQTPKRTSVIDLTTATPLAIPLNPTDSSDDEPPQFTPTPPKPVKKQAGYKSYPCRWQACQAELHSFDTLEQHVIKIHGKPVPLTNVSSK